MYITLEAHAGKRTARSITMARARLSDGVAADYLQFNSGMTATIELADRSGSLVV